MIEEGHFWEAGDGRFVDFVIAVDAIDTAWVYDQRGDWSEEYPGDNTLKTEKAKNPTARFSHPVYFKT